MKILLSSICLETGTDIQLALYYLKSFLLNKEPFHKVGIRVFDENQDIAGIAKGILNFNPQLVGFSCYLWNIEKILRVCRRLKKINPQLIIVLGGPEVSPRAQDLLVREKAVDLVVRGEGEQSFTEAIGRFSCSMVADLSGIKGISFRKDAEIIHNPDRPLLRNISRIPSPYLSGLVNLNDRNIVDVPLETMRGCSFRCHYCYYHKNFPVARYFALKRIAKELKLILSHKPREVYLMDPTFNSNPQRAKKILKLFIKYNRGALLHVELKAELIDREMARVRLAPVALTVRAARRDMRRYWHAAPPR